MRTIIIILVFTVVAANIYAQSTSVYNNTVYQNIKVGNKIYLKKNDPWSLMNKALRDKFEKQYKGTNKGIDEDKLSTAFKNVKISSSNDAILRAIKTVFSSAEIEELMNESLILSFKINKHGEIIYISFYTRGEKLKNLDLSKYSLLEDKLISTMKFKIPDPDIKVYTIDFRMMFKNIYNNTYIFSPDRYANP